MTNVVSWLRGGLGAGVPLTPSGEGRASFSLQLRVLGNDGQVEATTDPQVIELYGPGDVTGVSDAAIRTRFPQPGTPDAEGNYFAHIEFFEADLPWRYSPEQPDARGLTPWLALVVIETDVDGDLISGAGSNPELHTTSAALPPADQQWAWAHAFDDDGQYRSRLLCPRRLSPDHQWTACLVPVFEAGRRAGLGTPAGDAEGFAWGDGVADVVLPVYASWTFATGPGGDFRELARRLDPIELPGTIGVRDLDISSPGSSLPESEDATVDFVGVMFSPSYKADEEDDREGLLIEFAEQYQHLLSGDPAPRSRRRSYDARRDDPVLRLPKYGAPQMRGAPLDGKDGWYTELNTSPRHRAVAALGAEVVRADQEHLMAAAWEHAAALPRINQRLQRAKLAEQTAKHRKAKFDSLAEQRVEVAGPALAAIDTGSGASVAAALVDAQTPSALITGAFRRLGRVNGPLWRNLADDVDTTTTQGTGASSVIASVLEDGPAVVLTHTQWASPVGTDFGFRVEPPSIDPPQVAAPGGFIAFDDVGADFSLDAVHRLGGSSIGVRHATMHLTQPIRAHVALSGGLAASMSASTAGAGFGAGAAAVGAAAAAGDVVEVDLDLAEYTAQFELVQVRPVTQPHAAAEPPPLPAPLAVDAEGAVAVAVDAGIAIRTWAQDRIHVSDGSGTEVAPVADEVVAPALFARPHFTTPMYARLRELSAEYLVPGLGLVPDNTVGALSVNNAFVEAYLVGANHEMSRELRWREYPAELHHTWFDQFWDVGPAGTADIGPIGEWKPSKLGTHTSGGARLVVLVKGDLVKRYPNLSVYMVEAGWTEDPQAGETIRAAAVGANPIFPEFTGLLQPGVHFYGFKVPTEGTRKRQATLAQTGGAAGEGYFFAFEERPRAPRFGLNVATQNQPGKNPRSWTRMGWGHLSRDGELPDFVDADLHGGVAAVSAGGLTWFGDSASMAAITFRQPSRVLIHATALLEER